MKLLTLNTHSWQEENQLHKLDVLAAVIAKKQYDVIALQEVSQCFEKGKENFAKLLTEKLHLLGAHDYSFIWDMCHYSYDVYEEGVALLTRHPVQSHSSFFISKSEDPHNWKTRKIVEAAIDVHGETFSFYSCHLGWWHDEEEPAHYQVKQLLAHAAPRRAVLMGDFNGDASVKGEQYTAIRQAGFWDAYELAETKDSGVTVKGKIAGWDDNKQDLRIDCIFLNDKQPVKSSLVIFNGDNEPVVSDHFGVETVINV